MNNTEQQQTEKPKEPVRELSETEKAFGRSYNYYQMSGEEQWEEDKRLGILDWDGSPDYIPSKPKRRR